MPPPPSEWLREIGLAEFEPSAAEDIKGYAADFAGGRGVIFFQAFTELGAVEYALAPLYHSSLRAGEQFILRRVPPVYPSFPVPVTSNDVAAAIFKTDCGPFDEHSRKNSSELRPWDVFSFSGDMSKAELMGFADDVDALANPERMDAFLNVLAQRYNDAGVGDRIVESGLLAAQGLVWFAKLAVLRGEDYTSPHSSQIVDRFSRRYQTY